MPVLHQMQVSGNCYKVRLAARQVGVELTLRDYGLHDGTTRKWYLAEGTPLLPSERWAHAEVLQWMFFEQYSHEPHIAVARFWLGFAPPAELEKKRHLVPEWHARGNAALGVMETHLARHDWFAGRRYSIADIALYGYTHCAADGGFDLSAYPAVCTWLERVASEPGHVPLEFTCLDQGTGPLVLPLNAGVGA